MDNWIIKYIGASLLAIITYIIISNFLWLLFGSKLLQSLPGVDIKGITGTLRIALMLVMTILGFILWVLKSPFLLFGIIKNNTLQHSIGSCIQLAARTFKRL